MKNKVFRVTISIVLGIVVGFFAISLVEWIDGKYISKSHIDVHWEHEKLVAYMNQLPISAFFILLGGYMLGSFFGGYVAARISNHAKITCGLAVGFFIALGGIINFIILPHPIWYMIVSFISYFLFSYLGAKAATTNQ